MIETILNNFHLEKILWIVKKKIAFMIIFAMLGGAAAGAFAFLTNQNYYQASVSFYVYGSADYKYDTSVNISNSDFTLAKNLVQSYTRVLKSNTVLDMVLEDTGLAYTTEQLYSMISYTSVEGTAIFYVNVVDANPYNAMTLANSIAEIAPSEIARIVKSGGIEVVDYAKLPQVPYSSTNLIKFVLLGVLGGGGLSAVLFLFVGLLDTTIRRKYELRLMFKIPIIGEVPLMVPIKKNETVNKILSEESAFAIRESYNAIRTNMLFVGMGEKCPVFAITSAEQSEGKTLNSINLAISYAQLGKKVLLIDGDMRKPSVSKTLGFERNEGLSEFLAGLSEKEQIIKYSDNLDVFAAGTVPPNASELLASSRMNAFLDSKKETYDCIIIDLPPIGIVTDGLVLAKAITAYLMVVRMGQSKMDVEKGAILALENVGANISGFIFNGINPKSQDYTYRNYGSGYEYGKK